MGVRSWGKRGRASAEACFRQARARTDMIPRAVLTDHHQPYVQAAAVLPCARLERTGLPRRHGYTTQPLERPHVPTRDRLVQKRLEQFVITISSVSLS